MHSIFSNFTDFINLFTLMLIIPLISFVYYCLNNDYNSKLTKQVNILTPVILLVVHIALYTTYHGQHPMIVLGHMTDDILISVSFTEPSYWFSVMVSFLWVFAAIFAQIYFTTTKDRKQNTFFKFSSLSIFATMLSVYSDNLLTTFIFYELLSFTTLPLVLHHYNQQSFVVARQYLFTLLTSSMLLFLPAIIITYLYAGTVNFNPGGVFGEHVEPSFMINLLLLLFVFGLAKIAIMPFHSWLPNAMVAPTPTSSLLHAVVAVKSGVFVLGKIIFYIFGFELLNKLWAQDIVLYALIITAVYAGIKALQTRYIKGMLAYSTIGQLAYISILFLIGTNHSFVGGAYAILVHSVAKLALFFGAGYIYLQTHVDTIDESQGFIKIMPINVVVIAISSLSLVGLPPTSGFITKVLLFSSLYQQSFYFILFMIAVLSVLSLAYLSRFVYYLVAVERVLSNNAGYQISDNNRKILNIMMIVLAVLVVLIFLYYPSLYDTLANALEMN